MENGKKIKIAQIICDLQKEIDECKDIDNLPGGLSDLGRGRLEMSKEILDKLLELI